MTDNVAPDMRGTQVNQLRLEETRRLSFRSVMDDRTGTVEIKMPTPEHVHIRAEFTGSEPTEHFIHRQKPGFLTLEKSVVEGRDLTWGDGLAFPSTWEQGVKLSVESKEIFHPGFTGRLRTTITLRGFKTGVHLAEFFPLAKIEIKPGVYVVETPDDPYAVVYIKHIVNDMKRDIELGNLRYYFLRGWGLIKFEGRTVATGQVKYVLSDYEK